MLLIFFLVSCSEENQDTTNSASPTLNQNQSDLAYETIATNLQEPWEIVKQGDRIVISERDGHIVEVLNGETSRSQVMLEKDLSNQSEAGLLGIAFPPNFTDTAYAYYSYMEEENYYQRVIEIKKSGDFWKETNVLLDKIPGGQFHQGGRIEIGPDQALYITTGDATNPDLSQDISSLAGKILRMNLDGTIPKDNPFENSYVYSYGHRNPQGLAWDTEGNLYATEHGNQAHDEINRIKMGKNYGWPIIEGEETGEEMESPIVHSGESTWAPSGLAYLDEKFYFASLRGEGVRVFDPEVSEQKLLISNLGRVRDVLATTDGIYVITNNTDGRGNPTEMDDRLIFIPLDQLKELSS
ncbi:PQQ-dependent sugar dehydrogenase [Ornithinibacillus contaminans]|uniref:PQQ-dependent sugar dehydrogenase n=1 Tax=Ornithinibacillus contaminans TaxID=694055 RepID=UPI001F28D755|nr:PQQ-dependent sugar dehydrogenase [Ornithinibacillus contaminans]